MWINAAHGLNKGLQIEWKKEEIVKKRREHGAILLLNIIRIVKKRKLKIMTDTKVRKLTGDFMVDLIANFVYIYTWFDLNAICWHDAIMVIIRQVLAYTTYLTLLFILVFSSK